MDRANVPDSTIDRHAQLYAEMLEDIKQEPLTPYLDTVSSPSTQDSPYVDEMEENVPNTEEIEVSENEKQLGYLGKLIDDPDIPSEMKERIQDAVTQRYPNREIRQIIADYGIKVFGKHLEDTPALSTLIDTMAKVNAVGKTLMEYADYLNRYDEQRVSKEVLQAYIKENPILKDIIGEHEVSSIKAKMYHTSSDLNTVLTTISDYEHEILDAVGLLYIDSALNKGQKYLRDTNHKDLNSVINRFVIGLLNSRNSG